MKRLNEVTAEDVQEMAVKYLKPDNSHIIVVGQAEEISGSLEKFSASGKIQYFDFYGVEYDPNLKKVEEDVSAESVIESYVKAIGGREKLSNVTEKMMRLKSSTEGMDLSLTIAQKKPNKLFQELDFSVGKQTTIFDGVKGKIEGMGQVQNIEGDVLEDLKYQSKLHPFLNYAANNVKMNLEGIENVEGKDAYKMTLTAKNGKKYTHYYDINTGYKLREISTIQSPQGTFTQIIDMDDYRDVDGIMHPFKLKQTMGPRTIELEVESIKFNSGLADSMFEVE